MYKLLIVTWAAIYFGTSVIVPAQEIDTRNSVLLDRAVLVNLKIIDFIRTEIQSFRCSENGNTRTWGKDGYRENTTFSVPDLTVDVMFSIQQSLAKHIEATWAHRADMIALVEGNEKPVLVEKVEVDLKKKTVTVKFHLPLIK